MIQEHYIEGLVLYPKSNNENIKNTPNINFDKQDTLLFLNKAGLLLIDEEHANPTFLSGVTFSFEAKFHLFNEHIMPIFIESASIEKTEAINSTLKFWIDNNVESVIFKFLHHYYPRPL